MFEHTFHWRKYMMADMNKCLTSSVIRRMQIKFRIKCHPTLSRIATTTTTIIVPDNTKCWQDGRLVLWYVAGGDAKWYNHFTNSLAISYKVKLVLIPDSALLLLGIYPRTQKLRSHRNMDVNIYSSFLGNHHNLGTTQMSFNWCMDEQALGYSYNRMPQGHKQE